VVLPKLEERVPVDLAYKDAPLEFSREDNLERRRRHLFAKFVDEMLKRRPGALYAARQTCDWLSVLASAMERNHETIFYLEDLSVEWLPTRAQKWFSRTGTLLATWLLVGLLVGLIDAVIVGVKSSSIAGLRHGVTVGPPLG